MGKQIKRKKPKKISKYYKECEYCGNGGITKATEFQCRYCGHVNGIDGDVKITRGGIDD